MAQPMTRPMTNADATDLTRRVGQLCEQLIAEGREVQLGGAPENYALTVLIHAAAMQGAYSLGPGASRARILQATAVAQKSLAGAMAFYHSQLNEFEAQMKGGLN